MLNSFIFSSLLALFFGPLSAAASANPVYLRCDYAGRKVSNPSGGALDLILNEDQGTVTSKIWDLGDPRTDKAFFGAAIVEWDKTFTGTTVKSLSMELDRTSGRLIAGGKAVRFCKKLRVSPNRQF